MGLPSDPTGVAAEAPAGTGPPVLEETPEWFQRRFEDEQARKTGAVVLSCRRRTKAYRRVSLLGAAAGLIGSAGFAELGAPAAGVLALAGAGAGAWIVRRDASRLGSTFVFAVPLVVLSSLLWAGSAARSNPFSALGLLGSWLFWTAAGSFLAILNDRERAEILPY